MGGGPDQMLHHAASVIFAIFGAGCFTLLWHSFCVYFFVFRWPSSLFHGLIATFSGHTHSFSDLDFPCYPFKETPALMSVMVHLSFISISERQSRHFILFFCLSSMLYRSSGEIVALPFSWEGIGSKSCCLIYLRPV